MTQRTRQRIVVFLPVLFCLIAGGVLSALVAHEYRRAEFESISGLCEIMIEEHPETEMQVLSAVKQYHVLTERNVNGNSFLEQYGYRDSDFGKGVFRNFFAVSPALFFLTAGIFLLSAGYMGRHNRLRIAELTEYLEQVNTGAFGTIMQRTEDEFSRLGDEIYKTVTVLRQTGEEAIKAKANFAENLANIAHQLKTPITAASLSLQLMKKETPNHHAGQAEKQLERLNRLEEALLTLSKIDAGALALERSRVDIYTALNLAADNLNDLLEKENISVSIPDKGCVAITGDLEWTMEALINLMKNCMEHSKRGGIIHCDYSGNPLYAEILIWDDGEGFCPEDMPHLFERFYRGKGAAKNGIGIGLSLAHSIFELQNGNITARNLPEGGACFEIRVYSH